MTLEQLAERIVNGFGAVTTDIVHGELTVQVAPERLHALLAFCRDDDALQCRVLSDQSAVHWPAGEFVVERQPATTGWPDYRVQRDRGVIEINYLLRSWRRNHHFRVSVGVDDTEPVLPTATDLFPTANYHEREIFDFYGVEFTGHPDLKRILMPDEWVGHPGRKDYPLGGVEVEYENDKFIPSPQERELRQVVEGESS
nr:NADH-quinone oxidoreductase subunit C [Salsipaludibacter albus]